VLHKEVPFLRIGLPLCAGILSGLYFRQDIIFLLSLAFFPVAGFAISIWFNKYQSNQLYGISLTAALFLIGAMLYQHEKNSLSILKPIPTTFTGTLSDFPEEKSKSALLTLKLNTISVLGKGLPVKGSILIYSSKDSLVLSMLPGDQIIIKCTPAEITNRGNPYEFDYRFFMENKRIKYYAFTASRNILSHKPPEHRKLIHRALIIREKIIEMYKERGISGERIALVSAITLGEKSKLAPEQKQIFIQAGVMHIMAVSGLHVVILSLFIFKLLFFMKGRFNILRVLITILLLWSFAFVTGLTPSVLRATLMFTFLHAGNLLKRKINGINSVLASAFILIILRPSVIYDAGFLLSYSAVIFIICFYQELYLKLDIKNWLADKIWQSAAVTIVAQAGTLPLTIMLFNRFPTYFIVTNIIIVPLSSLLVIIGSLIPLLFPLRIVSGLLGAALNFLTGLTEFLTAKASALPYSNIVNIGMTTPECMLMAVSLFLLIRYILNRKSIKPVFLFSVLILLAAISTVKDIYVRKSKELIVYNTPGVTTIGIRTGKILYVYSDTALIQPEVLRHGATLGLKIRQNILSDQLSMLRAGNKKILICSISERNEQLKCHAEIVIVKGIKEKKRNNLTFRYPPQSLIFTSDVSSGYHIPQNIKNEVRDTIHFVRNSGAYIKRL
jgi:competence protein ComEC